MKYDVCRPKERERKLNLYQPQTVRKLSNGLYGLTHIKWGRQMWTLGKVRKDSVCVMTGKLIKKGEQVYHPITNKGNRYERIAQAFFEANR